MWAAKSMEPLVRWSARTAQYCWKVEVPSIEGWFSRVVCRRV
jgi:hypothetical protein